jgi:hypothetical protein
VTHSLQETIGTFSLKALEHVRQGEIAILVLHSLLCGCCFSPMVRSLREFLLFYCEYFNHSLLYESALPQKERRAAPRRYTAGVFEVPQRAHTWHIHH